MSDEAEASARAHSRLSQIALTAGLSDADDEDQARRLYVSGRITLEEFEALLDDCLGLGQP